MILGTTILLSTVIAAMLLIPVAHAEAGSSVAHGHSGRSHSHPLPSTGKNHSHNKKAPAKSRPVGTTKYNVVTSDKMAALLLKNKWRATNVGWSTVAFNETGRYALKHNSHFTKGGFVGLITQYSSRRGYLASDVTSVTQLVLVSRDHCLGKFGNVHLTNLAGTELLITNEFVGGGSTLIDSVGRDVCRSHGIW